MIKKVKLLYLISYLITPMGSKIKDLIKQGEGQTLDFKFCISDARKIARTISSFANSSGGTLLIGVKDNGSIAGVRSEEEFYMIETAARLFCKPEIDVSVIQHQVDGKSVLEVIVPKGKKRPYKAKDPSGKWYAYSRYNDETFLANHVMLKVWYKKDRNLAVKITIGRIEEILLAYLRSNSTITLSAFRKLTGISRGRAEKILADFVLCKIIKMEPGENSILFSLVETPNKSLQ